MATFTGGFCTTIPIPLPSRGWVAALPDGTADTLALDGAGGYVWEMATGEATLNGSETWTVENGGKRVSHTPSFGLKPSASSTTVANGMCTHFSPTTANATWTGSIGFAFSIGATIQIADGTGAMTVADWTAWLASNPVTVLYPLATPTTEGGYVDSMPVVPAHATITCPDLTDLAVCCCADEGAAEIASAWGKRYESRITVLEMTVAELVAGA